MIGIRLSRIRCAKPVPAVSEVGQYFIVDPYLYVDGSTVAATVTETGTADILVFTSQAAFDTHNSLSQSAKDAAFDAATISIPATADTEFSNAVI